MVVARSVRPDTAVVQVIREPLAVAVRSTPTLRAQSWMAAGRGRTWGASFRVTVPVTVSAPSPNRFVGGSGVRGARQGIRALETCWTAASAPNTPTSCSTRALVTDPDEPLHGTGGQGNRGVPDPGEEPEEPRARGLDGQRPDHGCDGVVDECGHRRAGRVDDVLREPRGATCAGPRRTRGTPPCPDARAVDASAPAVASARNSATTRSGNRASRIRCGGLAAEQRVREPCTLGPGLLHPRGDQEGDRGSPGRDRGERVEGAPEGAPAGGAWLVIVATCQRVTRTGAVASELTSSTTCTPAPTRIPSTRSSPARSTGHGEQRVSRLRPGHDWPGAARGSAPGARGIAVGRAGRQQHRGHGEGQAPDQLPGAVVSG